MLAQSMLKFSIHQPLVDAITLFPAPDHCQVGLRAHVAGLEQSPPVALVMVVVPTATASVVEMLTVADWQDVHAAAFLLSNTLMSVPVAPATKPPPATLLPMVGRTSNAVFAEMAQNAGAARRSRRV